MSAAAGGAMRRNVALLSGCFALAITGNVVMLSVSALVGHQLATDKSLATLPAALMWLGTAGATVPASFLMRRLGRRAGFMIGALIGIAGAIVGGVAVAWGSFPLFCLGVATFGAANGFYYYFRFAAAEVASEAWRSRAIAMVMAGGVFAAIVGPFVATTANRLVTATDYLGPFFALGALGLLVLVLVSFADVPRPAAVALRGGRPLARIARQPAFVVAVMGGVVGYGVMILVMSITPLAMVLTAHPFADAALVIQWHVLGMYAPSFITGHLIRRFGVLTVMAWGAIANVACVGVALSGTAMLNFWLALTLLGVGWNFLFIGATTLITETHSVAERAKTQAANEFTVFGLAAVCSFLSGSLHYHVGWQALNLMALPPIVVVLVAVLWLDRRRRAAYGVEGAAD